MLYKKNKVEKLDEELFKNPTSEYRGAPFWAWNCKLDKDELLRQIECLKRMGFGGFHMHSRCGMGTKYLGADFMDLIRACTDKAEEENMIAWLYDEDRWPSGAAGGYVTKTIAYRQKFIVFTVTKTESVSLDEFLKTGKPSLLACYDIVLNDDGTLKYYKKILEDDEPCGTKWYVYIKMPEERGWFNDQTYVDTMSDEAIQEFIKVTYEGYKKAIGDKFGFSVPAVFTDEPQVMAKENKKFADDLEDTVMSWTHDFPETFKAAYGYDLMERLPEIIWELPNKKLSQARYHYHDHITERFTRAFLDQCGKWCEKNGIYLTGHVVEEPRLRTQTCSLSEAMRTYRNFGIPGIDMLCDWVEFSTAKQAQSVVHQYGREGMLSELYGVTNWDFDFRGHKFQGDWQAALGVTVRVPHLSWVSMKGSAKRDFPASINYQSPWYKEYSYIEDHYARLNTALTRGKPAVKVGVIHPIESYWLYFGTYNLVASVCDEMEANFEAVINRLLFGLIDFNFISESLLPDLYKDTGGKTLTVGKMSYDAVIVPNLKTMRRSTLEILKNYKSNGGKLIFIGDCPDYIDALESDDAKELFESSVKMSSASVALIDNLSDERFISIFNVDSGKPTDNLIYNLREDGDDKFLFIAHGKKDANKDLSTLQAIKIVLNGSFRPKLYDTLTGEIKEIPFETAKEKTTIYFDLYNNCSLLLKLSPICEAVDLPVRKEEKLPSKIIDFKSGVEFRREEPNVAVLDMPEWSYDGKNYEPCEEISRIDAKIREKLGLQAADGGAAQPWTIDGEETTDFVYLRFSIESEFEARCLLAFEEAKSICLNGVEIPVAPTGWYVDKCIHTQAVPKLKTGKNELIVVSPIGKRVSIENYFLLGDFDVSVNGCEVKICVPRKEISFGSFVNQGMPFYGGNIIYKTKVTTPNCDIKIRAYHYRGALIRVYVDGKDIGVLAFAPYNVAVRDLPAGEHTVELKLFGNRRNTFGALHNCDPLWTWWGPESWYTKKDRWSYEYFLSDSGILTSPLIEIFDK